MDRIKVLKELREGRKAIKAALVITDQMITDLEDEENNEWKGPGGRPDGCPAS